MKNFPSLKGKISWMKEDSVICESDGRSSADFIRCKDVQKHCIDKKKIADIIDKDIKWFKDRLDVQLVFKKETKSSDMAYAAVKNKEDLKKADMRTAIDLVKNRSVIMSYLEDRLKKELGL